MNPSVTLDEDTVVISPLSENQEATDENKPVQENGIGDELQSEDENTSDVKVIESANKKEEKPFPRKFELL